MRILASAVLLLCITVATGQDKPAQDKPAQDKPVPGEPTYKEVIISLANTPNAVAAQIKVGSRIDIIVEEPGPSPIHSVFPGKRVNAMAIDKRKKDGHTISVSLTTAQAAAFDILKESGAVVIAMHKAQATTTKK
jgi:hypothetical protein